MEEIKINNKDNSKNSKDSEIKQVKAHVQIENFEQIIEIPEHKQRKGESKLFHDNVKQLKLDGFYKCFVSGSTQNLQTHHLICEWSLENKVDFSKLKKMCEIFDPYGYSAKMKDIPMTSVDDIRNLLVLSRKFHEEKVTGIHNCTFSAWVSQLVCRDNEETIPQDHNEIEKLELEHNKK